MSTTDDILFETRGPVGLVTLNRPKALNALTLEMAVELGEQLEAWAIDDAIACVVVQGEGEKGFCAGGDIRALHDSGKAGTPYALDFFANEYRMNYRVATFPKPYIAFLDGVTMGGGVGISVHGSHRVLTENTTFAMPETAIGLIPDVGGTYFLPRLPGKTGMFLGLTGSRLKAADTLYVGVGTNYVPRAGLPALLDELVAADYTRRPHQVVDGILRSHAQDPGPAPLAEHRALIDELFAGETVEGIVEEIHDSREAFAADQATALATKSPTSMKLTCRAIKEGAALSIGQCLSMEYRLVSRIMGGHDFYEGVRAVIIDKDNEPGWDPKTLEAVSAGEINRYFADLGADELVLPE